MHTTPSWTEALQALVPRLGGVAAQLPAWVAAWGPGLQRGVLAAFAVAVLLLTARRLGHSAAGWLAGLPTVTGPALAWLALDHGAAFASAAASGGVVGGAACALFALGYGRASARCARAASLLQALLVSGLPLAVLALWQLQGGMGLKTTLVCLPPEAGMGGDWLPPLLLPATLALCASCAAALPAGRAEAAGATRQPGASGWAATAAVSGLVSMLACLLAPALGPFWVGVLSSPPLLAAAVAWELHREPGADSVARFLRGYTRGLIGRSVFVALFGVLLTPAGLLAAAAMATGGTLLTIWVTARGMGRAPAARRQEGRGGLAPGAGPVAGHRAPGCTDVADAGR